MWASTSPTSEPLIRHWTNSENIPIAMITTGTISGVNASGVYEAPPGKPPTGQAERGERSENRREDRGEHGDLRRCSPARTTTADRVNIRSYHWSEKPSGGKLMMLASVKLIGTMTRVGASR